MPDLHPTSTPPSLLQRLLSSALSFALLLGGLLLTLTALLLGLLLAGGVLLWALLRGRRPGPVNLRWGRMPRPRGFPPRHTGEVVDVVDVKVVRDADGPPLR